MNIVGSCPRCGAPIHLHTNWGSVLPPQAQYTCVCRFSVLPIPPAPGYAQDAAGAGQTMEGKTGCQPLPTLTTDDVRKIVREEIKAWIDQGNTMRSFQTMGKKQEF